MQAQFNVKFTGEWAIDYTKVLKHTNPIEIGITTPSLSVFVWDFLLCLSDFLNFTQKEMLNNQQTTAPNTSDLGIEKDKGQQFSD